MDLTKHNNYYLISDEQDSVEDFASFITYKRRHFSDKNLVVDILKYGNLTLEQLLHFLEPSNAHRAEKQSFVMVNDTINIDDVPDELMVVPTLREAEDVIKMEDIERDLGF